MAKASRKSTEVLAVELGERTIKVLQGPSRRKNVTANRVLMVDTPEGSVDQYVITDWEKLKTAFKHEVFTRTKSKKIMFVMDHPDVIKRRLTLNVVDDSDLPGLVKYRLGEYLGFDMDAYIVQFSKIEESEDARGVPILDVFVSAIPKQIVESYVGFCEELSVEPYVLDTKTNVLQSLLLEGVTVNEEIDLGDYQTVCFIEMGQEQVEVNIYENGYFRYNHIATQGILGIFDTLADRFHLQPDEIEDLILSHSPDQLSEDHPGDSRFSPADDSIPAGTEDVAAIMQSYQVELINWIDGIHRVLLMFGGRQDRINQILAYGDGFTYPGTADMLRHRIRSDIQVIESISSWNASKRSDRLGSELYRFVNLIGLISK
ncbi:MAG TPA: pilus assembly protein PilM [Bacillota bacterium]|jgi:Tfp pilus assembly PilM family ATPase|nr:pilus assembly protein PilM [Fastidiosipila sp.]HPX93460.1 pilus assembly protein PilM [Bacillota bacterium]HQB81231.1 pilus assembly protein PilM [Bacillota bacterium]